MTDSTVTKADLVQRSGSRHRTFHAKNPKPWSKQFLKVSSAGALQGAATESKSAASAVFRMPPASRAHRTQSQDWRKGRSAAQKDPVLQAQQGLEGPRELGRACCRSGCGSGNHAGLAAQLETRCGRRLFCFRGQDSLWITSGLPGATATLLKPRTFLVAFSAMPPRQITTKNG